MIRLLPIAADAYEPSSLHDAQRVWPETNCYVDVWIEVLHALDLDPVPALAFTLSVDFEGDQWQFFKYPLEDLRFMYGLDVAEMNPWRALDDHVTEQLELGRLLTVEVDAYHLPDTAGVSYQHEHVKTTIVANLIDRDAQRLEYFHGAGYHALEGADYKSLFHLGDVAPDRLPPYVELIKFDRLERPDKDARLERSLSLVRTHLDRAPRSNPVARFRRRITDDLAWLRTESIEQFHRYAFATVRQFGACCELSSSLCAWLAVQDLFASDAAEAFARVARARRRARSSPSPASRPGARATSMRCSKRWNATGTPRCRHSPIGMCDRAAP